MLVYLGLYLVVRQVVDLAYLGAGGYRLAQHHVQLAQFAVDGRLDVQVVDALADEQHVAAHVVEALLELLDLHRTVNRVLHLALHHQRALALGQLVVLLRLEPLFAGDEFAAVELLVLLELAQLALHVEVELQLLLTQVELLLLHGHLGVAQEVLLLGQLGLAVENREVEVVVAEHHQHVAPTDGRALLHHDLLDDAALQRAELHGGDGLHLSRHAHVVVELALFHLRDGDGAGIHAQGR